MPEFRLAFDRGTVRRIDQDGRMHITMSPISKANVCGYYGREIPGSEELGLESDRLYQMLRDPEELAKAVETFNNLPLTSKHVPLSADDPQKDIIVGSTGTDAEFNAPYLRNSLVVWDAEAIDGIESDQQRELSSAYWYRADMTPGEFEGVRFDGVMRDIKGNHIALVPTGRAGKDVLVMDEAPKGADSPTQPENRTMLKKVVLTPRAAVIKGAIMQHLRPKLAQDASPIALNAALNSALLGVGEKNWKQRRKGLAKGIVGSVKSGVAMDADLGEIVALLDHLDGSGGEMMETAEVDPDMAPPLSGTEEDLEAKEEASFADQCKSALERKVSPEVLATVMAALAPDAPDYEAAEEPAPPKEDDDMTAKDNKGPPPITKAAMDAALAIETKATEARMMKKLQDLRIAERAVRPIVGELDILAMDSAESVYKFALDHAGVDTTGVHASAFPALVAMLPKKSDAVTVPQRMASDSANASDFFKRFPSAQRISSL